MTIFKVAPNGDAVEVVPAVAAREIALEHDIVRHRILETLYAGGEFIVAGFDGNEHYKFTTKR